MKKSNKQIIIIIAIAMLIITSIIVAYIIMRKKSTKEQPVFPEDKEDLDATLSSIKILQYGSRGEDVKRLQKFLNEQLALLIWKGLPTVNGKQITKLSVDGIFGDETQAVVKWYFGTTIISTDKF